MESALAQLDFEAHIFFKQNEMARVRISQQYDLLDGNLTNDGVWIYSWDAENRLTSASNLASATLTGTNRLKLDFTYDFMGRPRPKGGLSLGCAHN